MTVDIDGNINVKLDEQKYFDDSIELNKKLEPVFSQSKNFNNTENIVIRGDNYEGLKILEKDYTEKIKVIYIDPPYNKNSEARYMYRDNYNSRYISPVRGSNPHINWLRFMEERLIISKNLLKEDGMIFISIDDKSQAYLKILCDKIFGYKNFITTFIWEKKSAPLHHCTWTETTHEYILLYAKNKNKGRLNKIEKTVQGIMSYNKDDNDGRGPWKFFQIIRSYDKSKNKDYAIRNPNTGVDYYPPPGRKWCMYEEEALEKIKNKIILFGLNGVSGPVRKVYLNEIQKGRVTPTLWNRNEVGGAIEAAVDLRKLFDNHLVFTFSKPLEFMKRVVELATDEDDIVLDYFAGSGTTAHAVMDFNQQKNSNRKFILIQNDEEINKSAVPTSFSYCIDNKIKPLISSITIDRLDRAGDKIFKKCEEEGLDRSPDLGFKVFKIVS